MVSSTVLIILHSTEYPPQYCTDVLKGDNRIRPPPYPSSSIKCMKVSYLYCFAESSKELFEGDIVITPVVKDLTDKTKSANAKRDSKRYLAALWRTRIIPYEISTDFRTYFVINISIHLIYVC